MGACIRTFAISLISLSCSRSNSVRPSNASEGEVVDSKIDGASDLRWSIGVEKERSAEGERGD